MTKPSTLLRVAAYCRVSTDRDEQVHSLAGQRNFFDDYIRQRENWKLVRIYADEGQSGTNTKKRKEFNQMIADAEEGRLDWILTKEISRFARNTLDSVYYTRKLKEWGVGVIFVQDNINTADPDSELRLTIISSIAQEESRRTSDRVKWGQRRRMEGGIVFGSNLLGYRMKNGCLTVDEEEKETVRLIFHKYLENKGAVTICRELEEAGIPTKSKSAAWSCASIYKILKNEKYVGDLCQKKSFTPDYISHARKKNKGEEKQICISDHHEPIIDRGTFKHVQEEMERRAACKSGHRHRHSNRYPFSGKIICGVCGRHYVGRPNRRGEGGRIWQCGGRDKYGRSKTLGQELTAGCLAKNIGSEVLEGIFLQTMCSIINEEDKKAIVAETESALRSVLLQNRSPHERLAGQVNDVRQKIACKKERLTDLYLEGEISEDDWRQMTARYDKKMHELNHVKEETNGHREGFGVAEQLRMMKKKTEDMLSFQTFHGEMAALMIECCIVYGEDMIEMRIRGMTAKIRDTAKGGR